GPAGLLLVLVVAPAGWSGLAQAGDAALVVGPGVVVVALEFWSPAGGVRARVVEHRGEVLEVRAGVVAAGLVFVVAWAGEVVELEDDRPAAVGVAPGAMAAWRAAVDQGQP